MEKVKKIQGLTAKSLGLGIVLVIVGTTIMSLIARQYMWAAGGVSPYLLWPVFILLPAIVLKKPLGLTSQELAVIFAMTTVSTYLPYFTGVIGPHNWFYNTSPYFPEDLMPWVPSYFYDFTSGTMYWTVFCVLSIMTPLLFIQVFRRQVVNIERVSFPASVVPLTLTTGEIGGSSLYSNKGFLVAILLGVILPIVNMLPDTGAISPYPPEVTTFLGPLAGGAYPVAPFPLLQADVYIHLGLGLGFYAIALLMPLDFLLTGIIMFFAIYIAYPLIAVPMGIMPPLITSGGNYAAGKYITIMYSFRPMAAFCWAGPLAIGVFLILNNIGYVKRTLTGEEDSSEEILSYRAIWAVFLVCVVAFNALLIGTGVLWSSALLTVVFQFISILGIMYMSGIGAGFNLGIGAFGLWANLPVHMIAAAPFVGNPDAAYSYQCYITSSLTAIPYGDRITQSVPFGTQMYAYKMTDEVKGQNRGVFIGQIIAVVVALVLSFTLHQMFTMEYGFMGGANHGADFGVAVTKTARYARAYLDDFSDVSISMVVGFIIVIGTCFARATIPGFFLNPAAMVIAGHNQSFGQLGVGFICIVTYLVKAVLLRTYGTEKWNAKIVPVLIGFLVGWAIGYGIMYTTVAAINLGLSPGLIWW